MEIVISYRNKTFGGGFHWGGGGFSLVEGGMRKFLASSGEPTPSTK